MNTYKTFLMPMMAFLLVSCSTASSQTAAIPEQSTTEISTVTSSAHISIQCLNRLDSLPEQSQTDSTIILSGIELSDNFLLSLKTLGKEPFAQAGHDLMGFNVSPNHKMLYYYDYSSNISIISTLEGEVISFQHPVGLSGWLDDKHIIFSSEDKLSFRILDLEGNITELFLDLPTPYYVNTGAGNPLVFVALDPSLQRAVFFDTEGIGRIILWDLVENKMLASLPYVVPSESGILIDVSPFFPAWSPDASQFITTSPVNSTNGGVSEELFSISRNGQVMQLTHLNSAYGFVEISNPRWSPDGRHVAFWLQTSNSTDQSREKIPEQLVILDTMTQAIIDYCVTANDPYGATGGWPPLWSPDGNQLVVVTYLDTERVISLIDFQAGIIAPLTKNYWPEGWMIATP
jgi:DNA-binding beta-propeller fold protein YncE